MLVDQVQVRLLKFVIVEIVVKTEPLPEFQRMLYPIIGGWPLFTGAVQLNEMEVEVLIIKVGTGGQFGTVPAIIVVDYESALVPITLIATTMKQ